MQNFVQVPLELLTRTDISSNAKVLYALMISRNSLSEKNNWTDQRGTYIYYTIEEIQKTMNISERTAQRLVRELVKARLIVRRPQTQNKPYKIYVQDSEEVKTPFPEVSKMTHQNDSGASKMAPGGVKNDTPGVSKMTPQGVSKMTPQGVSKMTPELYSYQSYIDQSYSSFYGNTNNAQQNTIDDDVTAEVKDRIEYQELTRKYKSNKRTLNLLVQLIAANIEQYSEINRKIVENILDNVISANLSKVRNFKAYLQACIDNAYFLPVSDTLKSYPPSYNIAEYEKYSVLDYMDDDEE